MDKEVVQELVNKAIEAKTHSYSPYSKFRVGCSLLTNDNKIYTGLHFDIYKKNWPVHKLLY